MTEFTNNRLTYQPAEQYDGENWAIATVHFGVLGDLAFVITTDHVQSSDMQLGHPEADVRLWCAARDLYAACQVWDEGFTDGEDFTPEQFLAWVNANRRIARAALAKARGA